MTKISLTNKFKHLWESWGDFYFDKKFGVETREIVEPYEFQTSSTNIKEARKYQGSRYLHLKKILKKCPLKLEGKRFLDIGSGKGRVLLIAHEQGAKEVVGIEICEDLCRKAEINLRKVLSEGEFKIHCADSTEFSNYAQFDVIYMYNPFGSVVLKETLAKIKKERAGKETYIMVLNPIREYVFVMEGFDLYFEYNHIDRNLSFHVYELSGG